MTQRRPMQRHSSQGKGQSIFQYAYCRGDDVDDRPQHYRGPTVGLGLDKAPSNAGSDDGTTVWDSDPSS